MIAPWTVACPEGTLPDAALARVVRHLRRGGLLAYPTETVYGLGGLVETAPLRALAALKRRAPDKPFILLLPDTRTAPGLLWNRCARGLAARFWPGPLTLVLPDPERRFPPEVRGRSGGVAVRVSPEPVVGQILAELGAPLTSTSVNPPGGRPARSGAEVLEAVRTLGTDDRLGIVDIGEIPPVSPSTIVDCTGKRGVVLRTGSLAVSLLEEACPGTTVREPLQRSGRQETA